MPLNPVQASEALARYVRTEFLATYNREIAAASPILRNVMDLALPSERFSELYPYWEAAPHPSLWPRGQEISSDSFRARNFEVENLDWGKRIEYHANDEADDQTRFLVGRARQTAQGFVLLPERIFFQILTGSADPDLLPAVPLGPDGAAFFAAVAGGAARFGVVGGNTMAGSGVATAAAIRADLFRAIIRLGQMQDGKGQPLWPAELINRGLTVIYGLANEFAFVNAFAQVQGATVAGTAAESNIIRDTNKRVTLWSTPRITTNRWYVFMDAAPTKSVFEQMRQPLVDNIEDFSNSDQTRRTKVKALQWDMRAGYGLALPYQAVEIVN